MIAGGGSHAGRGPAAPSKLDILPESVESTSKRPAANAARRSGPMGRNVLRSTQRPDESRPSACEPCDPERRRAVSLLVGAAAAAGVATTFGGGAAAAATAKSPEKMRPQPGDEFVFAEGERKGQPVTTADLTLDGPLVGAWAKDPASGVVRDGSKLNRVLLLRIDPSSLDEKTRGRAAEGGVVAYSAFCTHAGCIIQEYKADTDLIFCHCHGSEFDPRAGGRVVTGPARRSLASLPVKVEGERVVVAGEFVGKLGAGTT